MKDVLLHACCAPCATSPLGALADLGYRPVLFFFNPNLYPRSEHDLRLAEARGWAKAAGVEFLQDESDAEAWAGAVRPWAQEPEGGERCRACFRFRLERAADRARDQGLEAFTTTLSVSPHKNFQMLREVGREVALSRGVSFLEKDFKKKGGFLKSVELSRLHGLYRQDYCGCEYSLRERNERRKQKSNESSVSSQ